MVYNDRAIAVYYAPNTVLCLQIFQALLCLFMLIMVIFYSYVLTRREYFHPNLCILLIIQPSTHWLSLIFRTIRLIFELNHMLTPHVLLWVNYPADSFLTVTCVILYAYGFERIYAMRNIKNYDKMFRPIPWLGVWLGVFTVIYSFFSMFLWYSGIWTSTTLYVFESIEFGLSTIMFVGIKISSDRAYRMVAAHRYSSVHERYMTAQNFKAAKVLMYLGPFKCSAAVLIVIFYVLAYDTFDDYYMPLLGEFYNLYNYLAMALQMTLVLSCHKDLRQEALKQLQRFCCKPNSIRDSEVVVESVTGQKMIFSISEETDIYFTGLQNSWNQVIDQKMPQEKKLERKWKHKRSYVKEI